MEIHGTQCCAVSEIAQLSHHRTAAEAMMNFCGEEFGIRRTEEFYDCNNLYTFTGVVKSEHDKPTYGPRFEAFILKHKLGSVVESKGRPNILNHPTHIVKVWVWSVNQHNLKAWYRKQLKKEERS